MLVRARGRWRSGSATRPCSATSSTTTRTASSRSRRDWVPPMREALRDRPRVAGRGPGGPRLRQRLHLLRRPVPVRRGRALLARRHRLLRRARHPHVRDLPARAPGRRPARHGPVGRGRRPRRARAGHRGEPGQPADLADHARPWSSPGAGSRARSRCWTPASPRRTTSPRREWIARHPAGPRRGALARRARRRGDRRPEGGPARCSTPIEYLLDAQLSVWELRLLGRAARRSPRRRVRGRPRWSATTPVPRCTGSGSGCGYYAALSLHDSDDDDAPPRGDHPLRGSGRRRRRPAHPAADEGPRAPRRADRGPRQHPPAPARSHPPRGRGAAAASARASPTRRSPSGWSLSIRTVDHHVSAVLAKLGVSSRGAAAARAHSSTSSRPRPRNQRDVAREGDAARVVAPVRRRGSRWDRPGRPHLRRGRGRQVLTR